MNTFTHRSFVGLAAVTLLTAAGAPRSPTPASVSAPIRAIPVAAGLENPWGLAFLPDGRMLVSERPGRLRIVNPNGQLGPALSGVPEVHARGQGGMLDVAVSPEFVKDGLVYFSYAEPGPGGAGTAVARAKLSGNALQNLQVIWRQKPKVEGSNNHWGSRLAFRRDGTVMITVGDRFNQRPLVQDLGTTIGKVIRINPDGSIPKDNPFVGKPGALPEIWSLGHRNVQAAALDPKTDALWTVEHGARGGDELNQPQAGRNYGWPVITYGVDYSGVKIGEGTEKAGMEQPVYYWDPVIAPSGATFYTGKAFPQWEGDLFVGSLNPGALVRLRLRDGKVTEETRYLGDLRERIRDVQQGPDGLLYLLTDNPRGRILRVEPARGLAGL